MAIVYFFSLIIVGVMIFLNLFLAILLENFDMSEETDAENRPEIEVAEQSIESRNKSMIKQITVKVKAKYLNLYSLLGGLCCCKKGVK